MFKLWNAKAAPLHVDHSGQNSLHNSTAHIALMGKKKTKPSEFNAWVYFGSRRRKGTGTEITACPGLQWNPAVLWGLSPQSSFTAKPVPTAKDFTGPRETLQRLVDLVATAPALSAAASLYYLLCYAKSCRGKRRVRLRGDADREERLSRPQGDLLRGDELT